MFRQEGCIIFGIPSSRNCIISGIHTNENCIIFMKDRLESVKPPFDGGGWEKKHGKENSKKGRSGKRRHDAESGKGRTASPTRENGNCRYKRKNAGSKADEKQYGFAPLEHTGPRLHPVVELEGPGPAVVEGSGPVCKHDEGRSMEHPEYGKQQNGHAA